ncbi:MAG: methyltransferase [Chryseobacterium sp.]|nr:MAG: methyltransferase [Chryseobacterium sp.]
MKRKLLRAEVQNFIVDNLTFDLNKLLLAGSPFSDISVQEIAAQIKGRRTASTKFPFLDADGILFPPQLNLEQASDEKVARWKAGLFSGKNFVDLTAGFGIDAYFLSENFDKATLVERNADLLDTVKHNWNTLGKHAEFTHADLHEFLSETADYYSLIYLDPARRDSQNRKMVLLEDLSPNIVELQERLLQRADTVAVKLSPLIDLRYLIDTLTSLKEIYVVALKNEVKEVLIVLNKNGNHQPCINCINLNTDQPEFKFTFDEENKATASLGHVSDFLYLPSAAILKAGAFNLIADRFNLQKLDRNTHLYTSDAMIEDFPGRVLEIEKISSKELSKNERYNIISKNHPLTPEQIKQKYKLKDGGSRYLIFTQALGKKVILRSK